MDKFFTQTGTATQSGFVAPTVGGVKAGVCPQTGFRRVDAVDNHALVRVEAMSPIAGAAGTAWDRSPWSPLIT